MRYERRMGNGFKNLPKGGNWSHPDSIAPCARNTRGISFLGGRSTCNSWRGYASSWCKSRTVETPAKTRPQTLCPTLKCRSANSVAKKANPLSFVKFPKSSKLCEAGQQYEKRKLSLAWTPAPSQSPFVVKTRDCLHPGSTVTKDT